MTGRGCQWTQASTTPKSGIDGTGVVECQQIPTGVFGVVGGKVLYVVSCARQYAQQPQIWASQKEACGSNLAWGRRRPIDMVYTLSERNFFANGEMEEKQGWRVCYGIGEAVLVRAR